MRKRTWAFTPAMTSGKASATNATASWRVPAYDSIENNQNRTIGKDYYIQIEGHQSHCIGQSLELSNMVDEPLKKILYTYCDVNAMELVDLLPEKIKNYDVDLVKDQLRNAIAGETLSVDEYESLTNDYHESSEELKEWLIELWGIMFGKPFDN